MYFTTSAVVAIAEVEFDLHLDINKLNKIIILSQDSAIVRGGMYEYMYPSLYSPAAGHLACGDNIYPCRAIARSCAITRSLGSHI